MLKLDLFVASLDDLQAKCVDKKDTELSKIITANHRTYDKFDFVFDLIKQTSHLCTEMQPRFKNRSDRNVFLAATNAEISSPSHVGVFGVHVCVEFFQSIRHPPHHTSQNPQGLLA